MVNTVIGSFEDNCVHRRAQFFRPDRGQVTGHFGKPNHQTTRRLKIVRLDVCLDY